MQLKERERGGGGRGGGGRGGGGEGGKGFLIGNHVYTGTKTLRDMISK